MKSYDEHLKLIEKTEKHLEECTPGTPHYRDTQRYLERLHREKDIFIKFGGKKK